MTEAPTRAEWSQILTTLNVPELSEDALALLTDEAEDVVHALSEDELDYLPMLPDDEHLLQERASII